MINRDLKRKWFFFFAAMMLTTIVVSPVVFKPTIPSGSPLLFAMLAARPVPATSQSSIPDIKINNNTSSLEVIAVRPAENKMLVVVLKNISSKKINGYEVVVHDKAQIRTDTSAGDWALSPGATHDFDIPAYPEGALITILAAMFTDGSIEGDLTTVAVLKQWRLGLKRELMRALPLLESALNSADVFTPDILDRLESQLTSLPMESDIKQPHSNSGARSARSDLISNIRELKERGHRHGQLMQRQRLLELKHRLERRIASL